MIAIGTIDTKVNPQIGAWIKADKYAVSKNDLLKRMVKTKPIRSPTIHENERSMILLLHLQ